MLGMEMMLKSMGLDPEEIKKSIGGFGQMVIDLKTQMDRIESKLDAVFSENYAGMFPAIASDETENQKDKNHG